VDQHHIVRAVTDAALVTPALTAWWWLPYVQAGGQLLLLIGGIVVILLRISVLYKEHKEAWKKKVADYVVKQHEG